MWAVMVFLGKAVCINSYSMADIDVAVFRGQNGNFLIKEPFNIGGIAGVMDDNVVNNYFGGHISLYLNKTVLLLVQLITTDTLKLNYGLAGAIAGTIINRRVMNTDHGYTIKNNYYSSIYSSDPAARTEKLLGTYNSGADAGSTFRLLQIGQSR